MRWASAALLGALSCASSPDDDASLSSGAEPQGPPCGNGELDPGEACDGAADCALDCTVQTQWVREYDERYVHVAVLPDDSLLLSGEFSRATPDAITTRLRSDGHQMWEHKHAFPGTYAADWQAGLGLLRGGLSGDSKTAVHHIDDATGSISSSWQISAEPSSVQAVAWSPLGRGYALWLEASTGAQHVVELVQGEAAVEVPVPVGSMAGLEVDDRGNVWLLGVDGQVTVVNRLGQTQFVVPALVDGRAAAFEDGSDQGCLVWFDGGPVFGSTAAFIRRVDATTGQGPDVELRRGAEELVVVGVASDDGRCVAQLLVQDPVRYAAWFETVVVDDGGISNVWATEPSDFDVFPWGGVAVLSTGAVVTAEFFFDRERQHNASRVRVRTPW